MRDFVISVFQERFHGMAIDLNTMESELVYQYSDTEESKNQMEGLMFETDQIFYKGSKRRSGLAMSEKVTVTFCFTIHNIFLFIIVKLLRKLKVILFFNKLHHMHTQTFFFD